jgi:predicted acetyltransferase
MIADQRGAKVESGEHGWLRIIDVAVVLAARTYAAAGSFVVRVTDPLGFADGTWMLNVDESGRAEVTVADRPADVTLTVNALSSIVLGGVAATTLRAAGIVVADESVTVALDAVFTSPQAPYLSLWY